VAQLHVYLQSHVLYLATLCNAATTKMQSTRGVTFSSKLVKESTKGGKMHGGSLLATLAHKDQLFHKVGQSEDGHNG